MAMRDIPPADWLSFFESFSRRHSGWLVNLEISDDSGTRVEVRSHPLHGVTFDDAEAEGASAVAVLLDGDPSHHFTRLIAAPERVTIEETPSGVDVSLTIAPRQGASRVVRICAPARTEMVDGVAPQEALVGEGARLARGRSRPR